MKRIISLLLTLVVLFASVCTVSAELIPPIEYTVTEDGVITEYFGEGYVNVPAVIGDTEIQKIGDDSMCFHPDDNIKRSEAAAIISRILFYDMRIELAKG